MKNENAVALGKLGHKKQQEKYGDEYRKKLSEWGRWGGRPKKIKDDKLDTK